MSLRNGLKAQYLDYLGDIVSESNIPTEFGLTTKLKKIISG